MIEKNRDPIKLSNGICVALANLDISRILTLSIYPQSKLSLWPNSSFFNPWIISCRTNCAYTVTLFESKFSERISLVLSSATTYLFKLFNFVPFDSSVIFLNFFLGLERSFCGLFNALVDSMRLLCFISNGLCFFHVWYVIFLLLVVEKMLES